MVFVRDGRAEQREDAVAGRLHDVAVVTAHRVDHQLQRGIENRARFFGIEVLFQLGRSLDVGEQRGHPLALAFERGRFVRCHDPDLRSGRRNGRGGIGFRGANRGPAFLAEARPRTHRCFASWANQLQLRSASLAE
jgi:hypothetical protein